MQFDHFMRDRDPAATVPELSAEERSAMATRAIRTASRTEHRRAHSTRWVAAAAALALVATMFGIYSTTAPQTASAQEVLRQAAINATDEPADPDQYWEITSSGTDVLPVTDPDRFYRISVERQDYVAVDGTRPSWYAVQEPVLLDQAAGPEMDYHLSEKQSTGGTWTTNISPADLDPGVTWNQDFGVSPTWIASLPRDVDTLAEVLRRGTDTQDDRALFHRVAGILTSNLADAELRKALFGVLQSLPDIVVSETDTTLDGRSGVGLMLEDQSDWNIELIVDTHQGEVIGQREYRTVEYIEGSPVVVNELALAKRLVDDVPGHIREQATLLECEIFDDDSGMSCGFEE